MAGTSEEVRSGRAEVDKVRSPNIFLEAIERFFVFFLNQISSG